MLKVESLMGFRDFEVSRFRGFEVSGFRNYAFYSSFIILHSSFFIHHSSFFIGSALA